MTRYVYQVDVDRILIHAPSTAAHQLDTGELRALVESAVGRELRNTPLPSGRTMRASVQIDAPPVTGGGATSIANAVATGVARAVGGGRAHG